MTRLVDAGLVGKDWNDHPEQGPRHDLRRLVHRPQGQPEEHQDLGRPAQAGREGPHPEPVHLGRGQVEPPGRLRRQERRRQEPPGRPRLPDRAASPSTSRSRTSRAARRCRPSPPAPATCCSPTSTRPPPPRRRARSVDYVIPDDTIKINIDIAVTEKAAPQAQKFLDYVLSKPGQERFADWGYRPVNQEVFDANKSKFPEPVRPLHHRGPRRLAEGQRGDVRSREGLGRQDRGGGRGVHGLMSVALPIGRRRSRAGLPSGGLAMGGVAAVAQPHRPAAAGRRRREVARRRPRRVLGRGHVAAGPQRPPLHAARLARDGAINAGFGTLIAWVLVRDQLPRQGAWSTRSSTCRSRCRRSSPA